MPASSRVRHHLASWGPVAAYMAGVSILSHQPSLKIPGGAPDWAAHLLEFAGLGALAARALLRSGGATVAGLAAAGAGCAAFAALDELHQSFVPGRDASSRDVALDAAGAALALAAAGIMAWRRRAPGGPIEIVIYGRPGCHLCEDAERVVGEVGEGRPIRVRKVDIDEDPELSRLYREQVPVVAVNGRKLFKLRVDPARLRRKLDALQHLHGRRSA